MDGDHCNMKKQYRTQFKDDLTGYLSTHAEKRFCAADIIAYLNTLGRTTNPATVYRNLDRLTESGVLMKQKKASDDCCYYQYMEPTHHCEAHLHLQCRKCGKIVHMEGEIMSMLTDFMMRKYGYTLDCKESMIFGICEKCRKMPAVL